MPQLPKLKIKRKGRPIIKKDSYKLKLEDLKKAAAFKTPTGRSAAAKKVAMKGIKTKAGTFMGKLKTGKPSPHTNKDESYLGWIGRRKKLMEYLPRQKRTPATGARIKSKQAPARAKSKK